MESIIIPIIVGILICIMGIANMKGNLSTLHYYHRHRVQEKDKKPFGRLVGAGTFLIGLALIAYVGFSYLTDLKQNSVYETIGTGIIVVALVVGLGVSFYAMKKYNKGIF